MSHRLLVTAASTGHILVQRQPLPDLRPGQIRVRVACSLISPGTELGHFRGKSRAPESEDRYRSFGYQNAGEVTALGAGVTAFQVGQRVACMGGDFAIHASEANVPVNLAVPLPDDVTDEEGAFVALVATAMHAVRRGEVVFGEEVVVSGLGLVGQLTAQVCQAAGARVLALDRFPGRVDLARKAGVRNPMAATGVAAAAAARNLSEGRGMDCGFLCFGGDATAALQDAVQMMKQAPDTHRWGRIVIVGGAVVTHRFGADLGNLDLRSAARTGPGYHDDAYEHGGGYPPVFVRWTTGEHLRLFVRWIQERKLRLRELITDRVSVEDAPDACYGLIDDPERHLGVIITY